MLHQWDDAADFLHLAQTVLLVIMTGTSKMSPEAPSPAEHVLVFRVELR